MAKIFKYQILLKQNNLIGSKKLGTFLYFHMIGIEKYLCQNYSYFTTVGKRNRRVPIIYPQSIEVALNCLVQKQQICGILQENQFLFANTTLNYIRGGDAIRLLVEQCRSTYNLQKTHLIKSTQLRKHVSTIAQILVLSEGELFAHVKSYGTQ